MKSRHLPCHIDIQIQVEERRRRNVECRLVMIAEIQTVRARVSKLSSKVGHASPSRLAAALRRQWVPLGDPGFRVIAGGDLVFRNRFTTPFRRLVSSRMNTSAPNSPNQSPRISVWIQLHSD